MTRPSPSSSLPEGPPLRVHINRRGEKKVTKAAKRRLSVLP